MEQIRRMVFSVFIISDCLREWIILIELSLFIGRTYATSAYANDENNAEALRWAAILIGSAIDFLGTKEKIEQGKIFKVSIYLMLFDSNRTL